MGSRIAQVRAQAGYKNEEIRGLNEEGNHNGSYNELDKSPRDVAISQNYLLRMPLGVD